MKHNSKEHLSKEEQDVLKQLHYSQIVSEIAFTILIICFFTGNVGSAWLTFTIVHLILLILSGILLFMYGTSFSTNAYKIRRLNAGFKQQTKCLTRTLTVAWFCPLLFIFVIIIGATTNHVTSAAIISLIITIIFLISILLSLIFGQLLWKNISQSKKSYNRVIAYPSIALIMLLIFIFGSYTTTEAIEYSKTTVSDSGLELGQSEIRQIGKNGQKTITHNLIFGFTQSTSQTDPTNEISAKGTRRYQYMYCSDGSYRYYTADQFKNPNIGYTHQSPDDCAKNGNGSETTIADTPPAKTIVQQQSRTPSSFHCYSI